MGYPHSLHRVSATWMIAPSSPTRAQLVTLASTSGEVQRERQGRVVRRALLLGWKRSSPSGRHIVVLTVGVGYDTMVLGKENCGNQAVVVLRCTLVLGEGRSGDMSSKLSISAVALLSIICLAIGGLGVLVFQARANSRAEVVWPRLFVGDCDGFNIRARNVSDQEVDWSWKAVAPGGPYQGGGTIPADEWGKDSVYWAVPEPLCGEYQTSALIEIGGTQEGLHDSFSCSCPAPREIATLPTPTVTSVPPAETPTPTPTPEALMSASTDSGLPTSGGPIALTLLTEGCLGTLFTFVCAGAHWARRRRGG